MTSRHRRNHENKDRVFRDFGYFAEFIRLGRLQCESTNSAETFCYAVAIGSLNAPTIAGLSSKHS